MHRLDPGFSSNFEFGEIVGWGVTGPSKDDRNDRFDCEKSTHWVPGHQNNQNKQHNQLEPGSELPQFNSGLFFFFMNNVP